MELLIHNNHYDVIDITFLSTEKHVITFFLKVEATEDGNLMLNGNEIHIFNSRDPADLDWKSVGAEYVIDSTGKFNTLEKCQPHLDNGAKKVLITAPSGTSTLRSV